MTGVRWRLNLLGGFELRAGTAPVRVAGAGAMLLLARLALPPQRAWGREELIELLWPGVALETGRNRLRQLLLGLRRQLVAVGAPDPVQADRLTLRLAPGALECDAAGFEAACAARPDEALRLYRGELLPGFYDEWVLDERRHLAALAARLQPAAPARSGLPRYPTRLLGAEAAAERLRAEVLAHRWVTVVGPGGAGKTRLAVEVAAALEAAGAPFERVQFVALAACTGPQAMADALQPLAEALAGRRVLLLLDNCEQLPEPAVVKLAALAARLPPAHWLATSRRVLGLDGEREFALDTLPLPPARAGLDTLARNPALALLIDRAQAVRPGFRLAPDNAEALCALVQALDGLPLAIELAATRLRSLPPQTLHERLARHGAAALATLERAGPRHGHDARQASMLKVVDWSGSLLGAPARGLLAALSVLEAPFELALADALHGGDAALLLDELVQHSMLRADPADGRYRHYELIREVAALRLAPADRAVLRGRHRRWLLDWARALPATPPLRAVRRQRPHLAAAFEGAAADGAHAEAMALFLAATPALSDVALPATALAALQAALARLEPGDDRAVAQAQLARALLRAGDGHGALQLADAVLAGLPAAGLARATVLARVAAIRWRLQRDPRVEPWLHEALAQAAQASGLAASVLSTLGALQRSRDPEAAAALQRRAIEAWREAGDGHGVNTGRYNLVLALVQRPASWPEALRECIALCEATRAAEDGYQLASALNQRGEILCGLRRWDEAVAAYREAIVVADEALEPMPLAYGLWNLPRALAHRREPERAARLMGFAAAWWRARYGELTAADRRDQRRVQRLVAARLGAPRAEALAAEGQALTLADALRLALG